MDWNGFRAKHTLTTLRELVGGYYLMRRIEDGICAEQYDAEEKRMEKLLKKFFTGKFFVQLQDFSGYGKILSAFWEFLWDEGIGVCNAYASSADESNRVFRSSCYTGWVRLHGSKQREVLKIIRKVGAIRSRKVQNTLEDLDDYLNGHYSPKKTEQKDKYLFTDLVLWKDVCKKLKKSKEYDELEQEQAKVVQDNAQEEQVVPQVVAVQIEKESELEAENMENDTEKKSEEVKQEQKPTKADALTPVEEAKMAEEIDTRYKEAKQKHAEANRRYKEKQAKEQAELTETCVKVIALLKRIEMWEELSEKERTALLKYAYKPTGNSIVRKVFGDTINIGDTVTVEQVFRITQMGIKEFKKKLDEWQEKEGVEVEYKENPDNIFASTYTIVKC